MIAPSSNHLLLLIFSTYSEDLTLFDRRAYFGPLKTQGKADLPQAFSSSHGGCDLLKNWLAIKFSQKSLIYDPVQGHIGLKSKIPEICSRIIRLQKTVQNKKCSHFARHLCGFVSDCSTLYNNSCSISTMHLFSLGLEGLEFLGFHQTFNLFCIAHWQSGWPTAPKSQV